MRGIAFLFCLAAMGLTAAAEPAAPDYSALEFVAGHCWKGPFPDGKSTDEHCFSWMFGKHFLRDVHHVRDDTGKVVYEGETIYAWDPQRKLISWRYYSAAGFVMDGTVQREGTNLVFPATYVTPDGTSEIRATWTPHDGGYRAVSAQKAAEGWKEQFAVEFRKVDDSK